jgi:hypothetical protein
MGELYHKHREMTGLLRVAGNDKKKIIRDEA